MGEPGPTLRVVKDKQRTEVSFTVRIEQFVGEGEPDVSERDVWAALDDAFAPHCLPDVGDIHVTKIR